MVITLVSDTFTQHNNGTTISAARFARLLLRRGHTVRVLTCGNPSSSGVDPDTGLDMYYLPEIRLPVISWLAHRQNTLWARPVRATVAAAVKGADVVHLYQPWPLESMAGKMAAQLGIPTIAAFHIQPENITYNIGLGWFAPAAHLCYYLLNLLFYRHYRHIHCPSRFIAAQLRSHGYKAWLHVISNGVDPAFCPAQAGEERPRREDGLFRVMMVGRFSPEKRQDVLLRAVRLSKYSDRIQVVLAGRGPKERKLRRLARKLPNPTVFEYYGQEGLIRNMRRCDLYVHTSDIEIEGMSCMEAFSCGAVPLIADSSRSATTQFALTPDNLFRAGSPAALAKQLDYWLDVPELRRQKSPEYAALGREYSLENSVRQMEQVYRALAGHTENRYCRSGFFNLLSRVATTFIASPILFLWTRLVLGVRCRGIWNVWRLKGGALTVCNHVHTLDSALVGMVMFPRKTVFPTLASNLNTLFPGKFVNAFGGVPVPQAASESKAFFDEMELHLENGHVVHFFPEGELREYDTRLRAFRKGAFRLAARARMPIVPMTITFVPPKGLYRLRKKPVMRITVGKPIYPVHTDTKRDEKHRMELVRVEMERHLNRPG